MNLLGWIRTHKLASLLLIVLGYFLVIKPYFVGSSPLSGLSLDYARNSAVDMAAPMTESYSAGESVGKVALMPPYPASDAAPQAGVAERLVIENSYLSLLVKNVTEVRDQIVSYAQNNGGYMVNSNISNPQDAPTATVTIRIPSSSLPQTLSYLRGLSVKVVSENLEGTDVTDQYVDIDAHIALLEKTKQRFESILTQATEISDITNLNQQILSIQSQIDSYKGQQDSLSKNAQLAKVTLYLSTDEIALPYAPSETWRPEVIFKLAVRSLVTNLRELGTLVIWIVVYAVVWVPALILLWFIYTRFFKSRS